MSRAAIDRRLATGVWLVVHPGVYRPANATVNTEHRLRAAVMWTDGLGMLSHRTGAAIWGLDGVEEDAHVHVALPSGGGLTRLVGVVIHRTTTLISADRAERRSFPVTSAARTLIDLAWHLPVGQLETALDSAIRMRLTSVRQMQWRLRQFDRPPNGASRLRELLAERQRISIPMSTFESKFRRLMLEAGLPEFVTQHEVRYEGRIVARLDFAFREIRLAIETDSQRYHGTHLAWRRDRERSSALAALGWRVIHVLWEDLVNDPRGVVDRIRAALAA